MPNSLQQIFNFPASSKRKGNAPYLMFGIALVLLIALLLALSFRPKSPEVESAAISARIARAEATPRTVISSRVPEEYIAALNGANHDAATPYFNRNSIKVFQTRAGYSTTAETSNYAMKNLKIDWKERAYWHLKSHMEGTDSSNETIYQLMISPDGLAFTPEETAYAFKRMGIDFQTMLEIGKAQKPSIKEQKEELRSDILLGHQKNLR